MYDVEYVEYDYDDYDYDDYIMSTTSYDYDDYIMYYKKKKCHLVLVLCFCLHWYLLPLPLNFQRVVTLVVAKIDGERAGALVMAKYNLRRRYVTTALTRSNDSFRPRRGVAYELAETVH